MIQPTEEYLTVREFAAEMRISPRTAYTLARSGRIPAIRVGSQLRVPRTALTDWLAAQRVKP